MYEDPRSFISEVIGRPTPEARLEFLTEAALSFSNAIELIGVLCGSIRGALEQGSVTQEDADADEEEWKLVLSTKAFPLFHPVTRTVSSVKIARQVTGDPSAWRDLDVLFRVLRAWQYASLAESA